MPAWEGSVTTPRVAPNTGSVSAILTNRWASHSIFWISLFLFNAGYIVFIGEDRVVALYNLAFRIPFVLLCCYLNLYFLMPQFYEKGRLLVYIALLAAAIFGLNAINLALLGAFVETPICPTTFEADATFNISNYVYKSFYLFSIVALTSGIKLSKQELRERQHAEEIKREKLETELNLLKSQINPHFFFNTLNSLYALTLKKSDKAPDLVLRLSDLMSYSLYDSDALAVPLAKELEHLSNYVELERVRLGGRGSVEFVITGEPGDKHVPPLIFLPLIENCFKHAAVKSAEDRISITLSIAERSVRLVTHNPARGAASHPNDRGGLGLKNLRRRLELIYSSAFQLQSEEREATYCVLLEVPVL